MVGHPVFRFPLVSSDSNTVFLFFHQDPDAIRTLPVFCLFSFLTQVVVLRPEQHPTPRAVTIQVVGSKVAHWGPTLRTIALQVSPFHLFCVLAVSLLKKTGSLSDSVPCSGLCRLHPCRVLFVPLLDIHWLTGRGLKPSDHVACLQPTMAPRGLLWAHVLAVAPRFFLPSAVAHPFRLGQLAGLISSTALSLGILSFLLCRSDQELLGQALSSTPKALVGGGPHSDTPVCPLPHTVHQAPQARPADHAGRSEGAEKGAEGAVSTR